MCIYNMYIIGLLGRVDKSNLKYFEKKLTHGESSLYNMGWWL